MTVTSLSLLCQKPKVFALWGFERYVSACTYVREGHWFEILTCQEMHMVSFDGVSVLQSCHFINLGS